MITDREGSHYNAVFFISEHIKIHTVNIRPEHFVKILFWCNYDVLNAARVLILTGPWNDRRFCWNISSNLRGTNIQFYFYTDKEPLKLS